MTSSTSVQKYSLPIAIIGLGKSGLAAFNLLKITGVSEADLITFDEKNPAAAIKNSAELMKRNPGTLVVSPGVSLQTPWIQEMASRGATITSEISIATKFLTIEKIIGVTGSVGKSTVVSLLGEGVRNEDQSCFVGGNIGIPFCDYALQVFKGRSRAKWIVLELSSYQLENCGGLFLDYSAVTYLSANHLERYDNLEHYYQTKMRITAITKNICVFNASSEDAKAFSAKAACPVAEVNATTTLSAAERNQVVLIGSHNHDNFAVAKKLAQLAGWSEKSIEKMTRFKGLSHRLEKVGVFNGVLFINDSKATAMDSVLVAASGCLENVLPKNKLILLLGGKDKNLPWENLATLKSTTLIETVFFGACAELAKMKSTLKGPTFVSLKPALEWCFNAATLGDTVLLSPGGTSLDEFKNFEERGFYFKNQITTFYK